MVVTTKERKEDLRRAIDDMDKQVNQFTSYFPNGDAKRHFLDTWKALKSKISDVQNK